MGTRGCGVDLKSSLLKPIFGLVRASAATKGMIFRFGREGGSVGSPSFS